MRFLEIITVKVLAKYGSSYYRQLYYLNEKAENLELPYETDVCRCSKDDAESSRPDKWRMHEQSSHVESRRAFVCEKCSKSFVRKRDRTRHESTEHNEDDYEFSLVEREENDTPRYAILSHTWETYENEYTFQDIMEGKGKDKPGYQKVRFCMERAARDRLEFCWIDTCCIDRSNRTELQHATESISRWYQNAERCYVYLSDISCNPSHQHHPSSTKSNSDLRNSSWFKYALHRPYLLAPASIEFFSQEGTYLGNQISMAQTLEEMRDVIGNTNSFYEMIPSQPSIFQQLGWTLPSKRTYKEEKLPYVPGTSDIGMINLPMQVYSTARAKAPLEHFSEPYIPSLSNEQKQVWMESLRPGSMDAQQGTVKSAYSNTCEWLLCTPEYLKWLDTTPENEKYWILCIKGSPGTGKSTLMKFLLDHAQKWAKGIKTISFFFKSRGDYLERSIAGAYRSLSVQLLEGNFALQDFFAKHNISKLKTEQDRQWTIGTLKILIQQVVQRSGPILCFIDAVDECPEEQARDMINFFGDIHAIAESYGTKFQVCFSTRDLSKISFNHRLEVVLEARQGHTQAIANYIKDTLRIGNNEFTDRISSKLQEMSLGVFLWVVLVVDVLNKRFEQDGIQHIWQRLLEIPTSLSGLFQDLLSHSQKEDARQLFFQFVLFARHPLRPEQLYLAIHGSKFKAIWDIGKRPVDVIKHFITDASQGLFHIREDGSGEVQFTHELLRQFLMDHPALIIMKPDINGNPQGQINERLKQCCLEQIGIDVFKGVSKSRTESSALESKVTLRARIAFPFMAYAVSNLLFHSNAAASGGVTQKRFLESFPLRKWVWLHNLFERSRLRRYSKNVSLLYVLGACNMPELIKAYPYPFSGLDIEDQRYGCAVFAAMATGSKEALVALLKGNVDEYSVEFHQLEIGPQFQFSKDRTILSYSAEFGFKGIVSALLENDNLDINTVDQLGRTPLMFAAKNGHEAVVKMLLDSLRVDVTSKDYNGETSLMLAAHRGHKSVVQILNGTPKLDADIAFPVKNKIVPLGSRTRRVPFLLRRPSEAFWSGRERKTNSSILGGDVDPDMLTDIRAGRALTDETNLSIEQIETKTPGIINSDDIGTTSSHAPNLPDLERDINISHLANDISDRFFLENPNRHNILWVKPMLPVLLRTLALDIGHLSKNQMHQNVMTFIDENQE